MWYTDLEKANSYPNRFLYLDKVQDPGNVGTIIRTADAFGFDAVLLSEECADVYSPKVVRSTMGSIFHLPIISDLKAIDLKKIDAKIYASSLENAEPLQKFKPQFPSILVIGNEGKGISDEIKDIADNFIKIEMNGDAESLNASIAAGVMMYWFRES